MDIQTGEEANRFKIIRDESIGNMEWNSCEASQVGTDDDGDDIYVCYDTNVHPNDWTGATLNAYLNSEYHNTLSTDAKNMIGTTKYYLGGYSSPDITTDTMWQYERKNDANRSGYYYGTNPVAEENESGGMIGLMYASDYGYGASKECTSNLYNYKDSTNCKTKNNWLDKSQDEWLLPQISRETSFGVFVVYRDGSVSMDLSNTTFEVRPVLSLSSDVKISGGEGTSSKPYTLSQ